MFPQRGRVYIVSVPGGAADREMITLHRTILVYVNSCKGCVMGSMEPSQQEFTCHFGCAIQMIEAYLGPG